jgi:hypothetical protein
MGKIKNVLNSFEGFKKWTADIEAIEVARKESFIEGNNAAADSFVKTSIELSKKIDDLTKEKFQALENQSKQHEDREKINKEQYNRTISELNEAHDNQCSLCRIGMENEIVRFKTRQMYFAKNINDIELMWQKMYQYSGGLIKLAEDIVSASAQLAAAKTEFIKWREDIDKSIKESQKYMNVGLQDGSVDLLIEQDKKLGSITFVPDPKSKDKKDSGGLL